MLSDMDLLEVYNGAKGITLNTKLRAVAEAAVKDAVGGRDRESDRHRFPDPAFNRWLDESITENGEFSVWHLLGDITPAWAAWESRPQYERKACDLCDCTGDIHDQTGEWRGECPYCRPQASAAVPEDAIDAVSKAMTKAWQLGQDYWRQADGDTQAEWDESGHTEVRFQTLLDETTSMLSASQPEVKS